MCARHWAFRGGWTIWPQLSITTSPFWNLLCRRRAEKHSSRSISVGFLCRVFNERNLHEIWRQKRQSQFFSTARPMGRGEIYGSFLRSSWESHFTVVDRGRDRARGFSEIFEIFSGILGSFEGFFTLVLQAVFTVYFLHLWWHFLWPYPSYPLTVLQTANSFAKTFYTWYA